MFWVDILDDEQIEKLPLVQNLGQILMFWVDISDDGRIEK
jgi:hypothetical protein